MWSQNEKAWTKVRQCMRKLYTKMLALLLGSVLLTSVFIGGMGIYSAQKVVRDDSKDIMNLTCKEKAEEINQKLLAIEQSVNIDYEYAESLLSTDKKMWSDESYLKQYVKKIEPVLRNTALNTNCALSIYVRFSPDISTKRTGLFLVRDQEDFISKPLTDLKKYDENDREYVGWYYEPIERGEAMWMDPYLNKNINKRMISYVIPIFNGKTAIGVIGMDIGLDLFADILKDIKVYDSGYVFAACENGDIVYHRDYPDGVSGEDYDENLLGIQDFLKEEHPEDEVMSYTWKGVRKMITYSPMVNGMSLYAAAPASEIDHTRNQLVTRCVITAFLILVIAMIVGIYLMRKIMHFAYTDGTSGARNKQAYYERVREIEQSLRKQVHAFSILLVKLANLTDISDSYGRRTADDILQQFFGFAEIVFGKMNIYRLAEDEFVMLIPGGTAEVTLQKKEVLQKEIQRFNREDNPCPEELQAVFGGAAFMAESDVDYRDVYARAERQLYQNKEILDTRVGMLQDALKMLQMIFHKIVKANLDEDTFTEIKTYEEERVREKGYSTSLTEWMTGFARCGQIHPEDIDSYLTFISPQAIRDRLQRGQNYQTLRYRRKVRDEFRWVQLEIIPSVEYSEQEQILMLFVRDIHDMYTAELVYQKELEKTSNEDALTKLYNRQYMIRYSQETTAEDMENFGIIFCDLNGLKYANDHYGHAAGDNLIISFAGLLRENYPDDVCCRMSGDEFVVYVKNKNRDQFLARVKRLRDRVWKEKVPLAAIGWSWQAKGADLEVMIAAAEEAMYEDKKIFYQSFPEYKR